MDHIRKYLAEIGRRGGIRSRRELSRDAAQRMVRIREARRVARRVSSAAVMRQGGATADTNPAAQAVQDALWRRASPAEKLARVARLSRMVDQLMIQGLRQRDPSADEIAIRQRRRELRLGRELSERIQSARHGA